jgi:hypothetical protein
MMTTQARVITGVFLKGYRWKLSCGVFGVPRLAGVPLTHT